MFKFKKILSFVVIILGISLLAISIFREEYFNLFAAPILAGAVIYIIQIYSTMTNPIPKMKEAKFLRENGIITEGQCSSIMAEAAEEIRKHGSYKKYLNQSNEITHIIDVITGDDFSKKNPELDKNHIDLIIRHLNK